MGVVLQVLLEVLAVGNLSGKENQAYKMMMLCLMFGLNSNQSPKTPSQGQRNLFGNPTSQRGIMAKLGICLTFMYTSNHVVAVLSFVHSLTRPSRT